VATPWRRYWARSADLTVSSLLVAVLTGAIPPSPLTQLDTPGREWIVVLLLLPFALTMDASVYWAPGNTAGKAIAGIKVLREGGAGATHVRQAACAGTALRPILGTGAIVRFNYRDRDGRELAVVSVSSADCSS
jgi:uncharacterized RDD family membrane protein YckC